MSRTGRTERGATVRSRSSSRLVIGLVLIMMVLSVYAARLVQLQGIDPGSYAQMAAEAGLVTEPLPATRGRILDRNGAPLADSVAGKMVVADPTMTVDHATAIARILSKRLGIDYFDTLSRLRDTSTQFRYLARRVPAPEADAVVAAIDRAGYLGISTREDPVRDYPSRDIGANLVGVMGASRKFGSGLEYNFDPLLRGRDGHETYEAGFDGERIPLGDASTEQPRNGHDLRLTVDRDVQWYAQRRLRTAVESSGGSSGAVVVMDTHTGELLALADYPTFDAADPSSASRADIGSRAVSDVYEPGSVEKTLTVSALLDRHKVTPYTKITVPSLLHLPGQSIKDYWPHGKLRLTMTGVIAKSSNIGTVEASLDSLEPRTLWSYLSRFGLGTRDAIGLPGASRGLLPDWSTWSQLSQATISYGQGVSVTALQMATAVNAIANGGVRVTPSLVEGSATTRGGQSVGTDHSGARRVISRDAASQMSQMMEMVTDPDEGTAPAAAIPGYRVAGKTGTANRVGDSGYYDGYTVSFAGFAPADDPRFTVYCVVQDPAGDAGGGSTCGPVFHDVMAYLLRHFGVPPTGAAPAQLPVEWRRGQ